MKDKNDIDVKIASFVKDKNLHLTKGVLSVLVQITDLLKEQAAISYPLAIEDFLVGKRGQVACLGGQRLAKVLNQYGIRRTLSKEGGRTSRGSIELTKNYLDFLNSLEPNKEQLESIQLFWMTKVRDFFAAQPLVLSSDRSQTVAESFLNLFKSAAERTAQNPGTNYEGIVLQHLVAAKLLLITKNNVEIHGSSVADDQLERNGDFSIGNSIIHCTTAPSDALFEKCKVNIQAGLQPIIITPERRVQSARSRCEDIGIKKSVEIWSVEQFLSTNVHEHGIFEISDCSDFLGKMIDRYNNVIDQKETDPSLKIKYYKN